MGDTSVGAASTTLTPTASTNYTFQQQSYTWWKNPYLLGSLALATTATLSMLFSLLLVCRRMHHFHYCSLFLVEMAVGSLTTEAIVHLLPGLILSHTVKPRTKSGMPVYFPQLATITAGVCILHALDTASIVFFGRRQSTSHAIEWRERDSRNSNQTNEHQQRKLAVKHQTDDSIYDDDNDEPSRSVEFEDDDQQNGERDSVVSVMQALANPRLCMRAGPYRLCSILSAGSVLHSFADGIAIGAAYVKGWESGLHLSISVGMHELSHKVADFAVLTSSGFSISSVVLLNACYWVSAYVGLFLSVSLSQKSDAIAAWIMTIATAVFVYVSLVTMSSMVRKNYLPKHITAYIIGNAGMTTGFILIMLASVLEFNLSL